MTREGESTDIGAESTTLGLETSELDDVRLMKCAGPLDAGREQVSAVLLLTVCPLLNELLWLRGELACDDDE